MAVYMNCRTLSDNTTNVSVTGIRTHNTTIRRTLLSHTPRLRQAFTNGLLTTVDCFSRWLTAITIKDFSANIVSKSVPRKWIVILCNSHHPVIPTDRGMQFQSSPFAEFNHIQCVKHISTTAYLVQRFHWSLKTSLATRNDGTNHIYQPLNSGRIWDKVDF